MSFTNMMIQQVDGTEKRKGEISFRKELISIELMRNLKDLNQL